MPIKPENRARYPKNWQSIRARKRRETGDRCERCGLRNRAWGYRDGAGTFHERAQSVVEVTTDRWETFRCFRIVLTVARLDHQPENNAPENLQLLCQRCHLGHDRAHHAESRAMTRRANLQTRELPF